MDIKVRPIESKHKINSSGLQKLNNSDAKNNRQHIKIHNVAQTVIKNKTSDLNSSEHVKIDKKKTIASNISENIEINKST